MTTSTSETASDWLKGRALALGLDDCAIASATAPWTAGDRLAEFLADGREGQMRWLASTADRRAHPSALWAKARSAAVLALNYGPDHDPREALARRTQGVISVYAQGRDYHDLFKGRLKTLAGQFVRRWGGEVKVFVDTAPLMEKPLAARAGLGWQGKHTNLVSRRFGSWLFLGVMLTSLELEADAGHEDRCGACRACLDVCPTGAFPAPYQLDARRCISYLTIEHRGPVAEDLRPGLGNRIFGCDDCLAVCPWNKFASQAREIALAPRAASRAPPLAELCDLDDAAFRVRFTASPVKRIGRDRLVRNVLYAIGNSGEPALAEAARRRLEDADETVREAAGWALDRLAREDQSRANGDAGRFST